jgi:hypothetical protein
VVVEEVVMVVVVVGDWLVVTTRTVMTIEHGLLFPTNPKRLDLLEETV